MKLLWRLLKKENVLTEEQVSAQKIEAAKLLEEKIDAEYAIAKQEFELHKGFFYRHKETIDRFGWEHLGSADELLGMAAITYLLYDVYRVDGRIYLTGDAGYTNMFVQLADRTVADAVLEKLDREVSYKFIF